MSILKNNLPSMEVYSIDEAFFYLILEIIRKSFAMSLQKKYLDGLEYQ